MSSDKPTKTEDEYFAREDAEKAKRLKDKMRQELLKEEKENIKTLAHMRCPKDGGQLNEIVFRGVKIDKCSDCNGVWLDNGELEKLAGEDDKSTIKGIFDLFKIR